MKRIKTSVTPEGVFCYGVHKPGYSVKNLRKKNMVQNLGHSSQGDQIDNQRNFPSGDIKVNDGTWIFEIPNQFPFRGRTYIDKSWADASADNPGKIKLPQPPAVSLSQTMKESGVDSKFLQQLPAPLLLALATSSTDHDDLSRLADIACHIERDAAGNPSGLRYQQGPDKSLRPVIHDHALFEAVANNPHLPNTYKIVMVIRPGAQGGSEIVGEWNADGESQVFEYLRKNSYIPWGHYAANMGDEAIRYSIDALGSKDIEGLRHLYYQRSYIRVAEELGVGLPPTDCTYSPEELEALRLKIISAPKFNSYSSSTLWGWNFGFDFAPSSYRLHASHQQIHQQYALIPGEVAAYSAGNKKLKNTIPCYGCGDLISDLITEYKDTHNSDFFGDFRKSIANNRRMDSRSDLESSLVVWSDENVMLFVPKAQTSQWELQLMTLPDGNDSLAGNILETNSSTRHSIDTAILVAQKVLAGLGAKMVTSIEYAKRSGTKNTLHQPLLYAFLPRLPESPGAFSEAQLRFINGHYPEDFAWTCRNQLKDL